MRTDITTGARLCAGRRTLMTAIATLAAGGACHRDEPTATRTGDEESISGVPIRGHVGARVGQDKDGGLVMVPAIEVWAHDELTGADSPRVTTNPAGYFETPPLPGSMYRICVAGAGYAPGCDPATVTVARDIVSLDHLVAIAPAAGAVWGTVRLADGTTPCFWDRPAFRTLVAAKVELVDAASGALAGGPVAGNSIGQYVIPTAAPPGSYKVRASCEGAGASAFTTLGSVPPEVDLVIDNRRPEIEGMHLTRAGLGIRRAIPGDNVEVTIAATDRDGDALHYTWADDTGRALGLADTASVTWPLLATEARSTMWVQVSDGKGGFAVWQRDVATDDADVVFSGRVIDRATGAPIDQAEVSVAGAAALTGSDGGFEIAVPDAMRFVLNANKRGYALTSRVYNISNRGLEIPLDRALVLPFDATTGGTLRFVTTRNKQDKPLLFDMQIEPGSFVDDSGAAYSGPATMEYFQYDTSLPYPIPGDQAGEWRGTPVRLETKGSFHLQPRDSVGRRLQMASGKRSEVAFDIEPGMRASAPTTIPFFLYDEATGIWKEHGTMTRAGDRYLGRVKHFTPFNADTTFESSSCLRILFEPGVIPDLAFPLHVSGFYENPARGGFAHNDTTIPDLATPIGIIRLAPFEDFAFEIRDRNHVLLLRTIVNTGDVVPPGIGVEANGNVTDPNFTPCHAVTMRLGTVPEPHPTFLVPAGTPDRSEAYRRATDALPGQPKATLPGWKAANGFPPAGLAGDEAHGVYFNDGDLKFGRDMHCRKDPTTRKTACYVTNYGRVGTDTSGDALRDLRAARNPVATVAMEHDPSAPAGQGVQFWAYDGGDQYLALPVLDNEGGKPVPEMCQACHFGFVSDGRAVGSVFLPFDIESFRYDDAGNPFQGGPIGAARQADFQRLNAMVLDTNPSEATSELIRLWYPTGASAFRHVTAADDSFPFESRAHAPLYDDVVATVCRTCHVAQSRSRSWTRYPQLNTSPDAIRRRVCGPRSPLAFSMPRAEVPFKRFWQRGLDDILVRDVPLSSCPDR